MGARTVAGSRVAPQLIGTLREAAPDAGAPVHRITNVVGQRVGHLLAALRYGARHVGLIRVAQAHVNHVAPLGRGENVFRRHGKALNGAPAQHQGAVEQVGGAQGRAGGALISAGARG